MTVALGRLRRYRLGSRGEPAMLTKLNVAKMMLAMKHPQHASYTEREKKENGKYFCGRHFFFVHFPANYVHLHAMEFEKRSSTRLEKWKIDAYH